MIDEVELKERYEQRRNQGYADDLNMYECAFYDGIEFMESKIEKLESALKEVLEETRYAERHNKGTYGFLKYAEANGKCMAIAIQALQE